MANFNFFNFASTVWHAVYLLSKFRKPGKFINFQAKSYDELIDFKQFKPSLYSSPPLFKDHSIKDIKTKTFSEDIMKVLGHSQHVERFVYVTSQAGLYARVEEGGGHECLGFEQGEFQ